MRQRKIMANEISLGTSDAGVPYIMVYKIDGGHRTDMWSLDDFLASCEPLGKPLPTVGWRQVYKMVRDEQGGVWVPGAWYRDALRGQALEVFNVFCPKPGKVKRTELLYIKPDHARTTYQFKGLSIEHVFVLDLTFVVCGKDFSDPRYLHITQMDRE